MTIKQNIHLERVKKNLGKQAFSYHAANDWNSLPVDIRNIYQIKTFKSKLKKHLATFVIAIAHRTLYRTDRMRTLCYITFHIFTFVSFIFLFFLFFYHGSTENHFREWTP